MLSVLDPVYLMAISSYRLDLFVVGILTGIYYSYRTICIG